jgi:hypothetical protein
VTPPLADTPHGLACTAARSMDDALGSYVPARAGSPTPRHPRCWEISGARFTRTRCACSRGPVTAFLDVAFRVSVPLAAWPNPNRGYCSSRGAVSRTRPRQRTRCFTLAGWISVPCHRSTSFIPIILLSTLITCEAPSVFFSLGQRKFCSTCLMSALCSPKHPNDLS